MSNKNESLHIQDIWSFHTKTRLGMLIDPAEQGINISGSRAKNFELQGGEAILIGGSGYIDSNIFQETVEAVINKTSHIPIIIFPGHIDQIPNNSKGIAGVLNYSMILGTIGSDFDKAFPPKARKYFNETLDSRKHNSIKTLYVLCGDASASVSQVSGIMPMNLSDKSEEERMLRVVDESINNGVECIFYDTGSRAKVSTNINVLRKVKESIKKIRPETLLFIGGGIDNPEQASIYNNTVDCISIGTYFEKNGVVNVAQFLSALAN